MLLILASPAALRGGSARTQVGDALQRPVDGMVMVYVPAGEFVLGSTDREVEAALGSCNEKWGECEWEWFEDEYPEYPEYQVVLDGYWIDRYEVDNAQYRQCVEDGSCQAAEPCDWREPPDEDSSRPDHPVVCVNWEDAWAYCERAGARLST